jgi:tetratricopeptide (TPR) repeat protein
MFKKSIIGFSKKIGISRISKLDKKTSISHFKIGKIKEKSENYKDAILNYTDAILLNPLNHSALLRRGYCRLREEKYEKSLKDLNRSIELNPENSEAYVWRSAVTFSIDNKGSNSNIFLSTYAEKALIDLNVAIELDPNSYLALSKRQNMNSLAKKYKSELLDLNKLISMNPNDKTLYEKRGWLYFKRSMNIEIVKEDWERAVELGSTKALDNLNRYVYK